MRSTKIFALLLACGMAQADSIPLTSEHGIFVVPVSINGKITLNFTIDSGAADVSVPADVFSTLVRADTVSKKDLLEMRVYTLADGSKQSSQLFHIASLKIGTVEVLDVIGSIAPASGPLLLGQSFLSRLPSWSIDNRRQLILIDASPTSVTRDVVMHSRDAEPIGPNAFIFPEIAKLGKAILSCGISVNWSEKLDAKRSIQYIVSLDLNETQARDPVQSEFSLVEARTAMVDLSKSPIPGYDGPAPTGLSFGVNSQTDLIRMDGAVGPSWTGGDEGMFRSRIEDKKERKKRQKLRELWNHLLNGQRVYVVWESSTGESRVFPIEASVKPNDKAAVLTCVRDFESQRL
jgi:hypothetical protein